MISCQSFRANLQSRSPEVLEHLRKCDSCLDHAIAVDPDNFCRAIGGEELEPPGGIDAFASDVMAQVRLRQAEGSVARRFLIAPRRLGYLWALALAAAGLVAAELIAVALHAGGPRLGMLHPAADALGVAGFELVGTLLTPSRRGSP